MRLRKLQFFKAVESCTGGYGRFRCQRVNSVLCTVVAVAVAVVYCSRDLTLRG